MSNQPVVRPPAEDWENEGGGLGLSAYSESLGVTRVMTASYVVGGYSYTNLADAVAQGRRIQAGSTAS